MAGKAAIGRSDKSMWSETPSGNGGKRTDKKINIRSVAAVLQERGLEPIGAICDVLGSLEPSMQVRTLLALSEFVYPKLGRVEHTGEDGGPIKASLEVAFVK